MLPKRLNISVFWLVHESIDMSLPSHSGLYRSVHQQIQCGTLCGCISNLSESHGEQNSTLDSFVSGEQRLVSPYKKNL